MIGKAHLEEKWVDLMHDVRDGLQAALHESGLSQREVATRLGKDPAFVSRCFAGRQNLELRTASDLARAMGFRVDVRFVALASLPPANRRPQPANRTDGRVAMRDTASGGVTILPGAMPYTAATVKLTP